MRLFVVGSEAEKQSLEEGQRKNSASVDQTTFATFAKLAWCAVGLLGSYLLWGVMQVRVEGIVDETF